jgi:hypothetical protein
LTFFTIQNRIKMLSVLLTLQSLLDAMYLFKMLLNHSIKTRLHYLLLASPVCFDFKELSLFDLKFLSVKNHQILLVLLSLQLLTSHNLKVQDVLKCFIEACSHYQLFVSSVYLVFEELLLFHKYFTIQNIIQILCVLLSICLPALIYNFKILISLFFKARSHYQLFFSKVCLAFKELELFCLDIFSP